MFEPKFVKDIALRAQEWLDKRYGTAAERMGERRKNFRTNAGLEVKPLYTPADIADNDYAETLGFPGEFPYTRGSYPIGYRSRFWQPQTYVGFGTGEETNERLKVALANGQSGLNIIADLPTSYHGIDADDPKAEGEVGKTGVSINSIEDMAAVFKDIPIEETSVTFNTTGVVVPAFYFAMAEERGLKLAQLSGTCLNNPLGSYVSCNSGVLPAPQDALRELADQVAFAGKHMPKWSAFNIGSYEYRENGATAVQELAFMFGNAIAYSDAFLARGMDFDDVAPQYVFYTSIQTNLFEEIAKYRAARRIWSRLATERYGAKKPASMIFRIHTQTSGFTLTAEQPLNNIVRATIQSLAAVLGGTNSLYTDPYDEALCLPSELGLRTATRTQQIIMEESGIADTINPLGGSYFVEALTDRMEAEALAILEQIEDQGGMVKAVENGWVQTESELSIADYLARVDSGEHVIVGHNKHRIEEDIEPSLFTIDPSYEIKQRQRLAKLRQERDDGAVEAALAALRAAARNDDNLVRPAIEAAKARATFAEMTQTIYDEMRSFRDSFNDMKLRLHA
ncbi:MAG: methylmalonyl-CoA mutase family protein [Alphaproteobacteria bacterium]|nr:methylmalonyl-CoA mutase family protein [Alphaproteobacteria bacterium]